MYDFSVFVADSFYKNQGIITVVHDGKVIGFKSENAHLAATR